MFFSEYVGSQQCLGIKMDEWCFVSFIFYLIHISFPVIGILVCMRNIQIAGAIEILELGNIG